MSDTFNFDDFFFKDSDTSSVSVEARGKILPFKIKKGVSFADIRSAQKNAVKVIYKPDGSIQDIQSDEGIAQLELLARTLKEWPFHQNGEPVPITRENLDLLDGQVVQQLVLKVRDIIQKGHESLDPLGSPSDAAS